MAKMRKRERVKLRKAKNTHRMWLKRQMQKDVSFVLESIICAVQKEVKKQIQLQKDVLNVCTEEKIREDRLAQRMGNLREKRRDFYKSCGTASSTTSMKLRSSAVKDEAQRRRVAIQTQMEGLELKVNLSKEKILFHVRTDLPIEISDEAEKCVPEHYKDGAGAVAAE